MKQQWRKQHDPLITTTHPDTLPKPKPNNKINQTPNQQTKKTVFHLDSGEEGHALLHDSDTGLLHHLRVLLLRDVTDVLRKVAFKKKMV